MNHLVQVRTAPSCPECPGMGVEVVVFRDLKDNVGLGADGNWKPQYGGYAERYAGVEHSDGSPKPGFDALMALASPAAPPPPVDPCAGLKAELAASRTALAAAEAKLEAVRRAVA